MPGDAGDSVRLIRKFHSSARPRGFSGNIGAVSTPSKSEILRASLREMCSAVHVETRDTVFRLGNRTYCVFFVHVETLP